MSASVESSFKARPLSRVVLECQDLGFVFPNKKVAYEHINIKTYQDELVAIVGPTGTGKSTLLRNLSYLIPPTCGKVFLEGKQVKRPSSQISLIHQSIATFPWMKASDNVKLGLTGLHVSDEQANCVVKEMLTLVGLENYADYYPKEMSGGMRQRIAIARALATSPKVLLMDEPFVHLDELTASGLRQEIYQLVFSPETTLDSAVLVSHNLHEVVQLADRVYVMCGSPAAIFEELKIDLPRPRAERDSQFQDYLDRLLTDLKPRSQV